MVSRITHHHMKCQIMHNTTFSLPREYEGNDLEKANRKDTEILNK
uniref:Uncharacterized protein n=1 Tax=Rhizophora mucronata TaxID=61149 RepID=A0A2P2PH09_RHIMU